LPDLVAISPTNRYICWAPPEGLDANNSDATVLATHGLLQNVGYSEVIVADSHYPYANFICTRKPAHNALDLVVNNVISSIRDPIEVRFSVLKMKYPAFRFGWFHKRTFLNDLWGVMTHALNFILQFDQPEVNINNYFFLDFEE
jgi:hypothetical protein